MPGPDEFAESLSRIGRKTERRGAIVIVQVDAPLGPLAGTVVGVGADPPNDFPRVPPHWVHLPERIELPGGKRQASELGPGWSKWSRKHPRWRADLSSASQWIAHVRSLLAAASVT